MIAFEVSLNGNIVCTAGIGDFGVLTSMLTWVRRRPESSRDHDSIEEELTVDVSALDSRDPAVGEQVKWLSETLRVGDRVSVRVVEVDVADPPIERRRDDPAAVARSKRKYYEQMKREYED